MIHGFGQVMRILPHGTTIVWDAERERAWPYYDTGYAVDDFVAYSTDEKCVRILCMRPATEAEVERMRTFTT